MPGSTTKKILITLLVFLVLAAAAWYGLFLYIRKTAEAASAFEEHYKEQVAQEERDKSLRAFLGDVGTTTDFLLGRVIGSAGTVPFIEMIEDVAKENGLSISMSLAPDANAPHKETYEYLKLSLSTQGSWQGTYIFLSLIESLPHKIKINHITLTQEIVTDPPSKANKKPVERSSWKMVLEFSVLRQKGK